MFFSKNIGITQKQQLSDGMKIHWKKDLGKYLGFPIFHQRPSQDTFQFIMDKVHQRTPQ